MRYFNCMLNTNSELIKANSKIRLNDYDYSGDCSVEQVYVQASGEWVSVYGVQGTEKYASGCVCVR